MGPGEERKVSDEPGHRVALFDDAVGVEPLGDGRYRAEIDAEWSALAGPNGGYLAALVLRALEAEVADPERAPRSLTCHFLRPPVIGPCEIHVVTERRGGRMSTLTARVVSGDRTTTMAIAAFGKDFPGTAPIALPAPSVAPAVHLHNAGQRGDAEQFTPPIADRVAVEHRFGPPPFSGGADALTGGWTRLDVPRVVDAAVIALMSDAWIPPIWAQTRDVLPLVPTIDLTIHFRARLPYDLDPEALTLARFVSRAAAGGFVEEDGELWAADGTLLAQSRQLACIL
jgi:acyl-CoA thioesterase